MPKIGTVASVSWLSFLGLASTATAQTLPNGIAAGDVDQTSAVLWARSTAVGPVMFDYADDPSLALTLRAEATVVDPAVPVKVELVDLRPGSTYYYRVTNSAGGVDEGHFRTPEAEGLHGLRFGVSGDWRGDLRPYPSISNVVESDLDFFAVLGDTIYADIPTPDVPTSQARTLDELRLKHNEVYSERFGVNTWAEIRSTTALYACLDDHEMTNDFCGGAPPSTDPRFDQNGAFINETDLYHNGMQAFQEFNPVREGFYGDTGDPRTSGKPKLYRERRFGADAAFLMVDARSFRDASSPRLDHLPNGGELRQFLATAYDPSRTMLGAAQLELLRADLLAAQVDGVNWKFVMIGEPIQNLSPVLGSDRFEGYAHERAELLSFINDHAIENVVFITADIHGTIVNNVVFRRSPRGPQIPTDTFEISTGPVAFAKPLGPATIAYAPPVLQAAFDRLDQLGRDALALDVIDGLLLVYRYPQVGLAGSPIDARLLEGRYLAVNWFGWTKFEIDAATQCLTVTTYGIDWYTPEELSANPNEVLSRRPEIVSQIRVAPQGRMGTSSAATPDGAGSCTRSASTSCGALGVVGTMSLLATPVFRLVHRRRSGRTIRQRER